RLHRDEIRRRFADEWLAPLDRSGVPARKLLRDGPAASVLLDVAREEHADLIVVGKRGTGRFEAALLGSSALQVAEHAASPVLIVPDGHPPEEVVRVVVGIDGSTAAENALRWAVGLTQLLGASLTVAHIADESSVEVRAGDDADLGAVNEAVDAWCVPAAEAGIEVRRLVERGEPTTRLVELSEPAGTVLVVGNRGPGGFDDLRLGSVSNRIVHHARCPVVVVHPPR